MILVKKFLRYFDNCINLIVDFVVPGSSNALCIIALNT